MTGLHTYTTGMHPPQRCGEIVSLEEYLSKSLTGGLSVYKVSLVWRLIGLPLDVALVCAEMEGK